MVAIDWEPFAQYVERVREVYHLPGVAVAVAQDGKPVMEQGFGWRDREQVLPVTPYTVFGIGSVTKSFTAVAIMQLEEEGKLSVEDPVVRYLPEFRVGKGNATSKSKAARAMTIHHFLTHTSGLPPLPSLFFCMARTMEGDPAAKELPDALRNGSPIDTYEQLMDFMAGLDIELLGPPGAYFSYSNEAYGLLGAIVERVSGRPYQSFVSGRILEPLGMEQTTFDLAVMERLPEVTVLYATRDEEGKEEVFAAPRWWEAPAMVAAGFLRSNVRDMLRYMEIYRTGGVGNGQRILSEQSVARMTVPHARLGPAGYGYGLIIHPNYHGVSLVEHSGGIKGVAAHVTCVPERGITGVALANLGGVPSGQVLLGAINTLLGLPVNTRRFEFADYACPPRKLARYAGEYRSGEGAQVKVSVAGNELEFEMEGKRFPGRPVGVDMFAVEQKEEEALVRFLFSPRGDVFAVELGARIVRRSVAEAS